jgi:hypothetical protein
MKAKIAVPTTDATVNITSAGWIDLGDIINYSFEGVFSGSTLGGTLKLQASNTGGTHAGVDISGATSTIASAGDAIIEVSDAGHRYVRPHWTQSGGTGNITIRFIGKERLSPTTNRSGK